MTTPARLFVCLFQQETRRLNGVSAYDQPLGIEIL